MIHQSLVYLFFWGLNSKDSTNLHDTLYDRSYLDPVSSPWTQTYSQQGRPEKKTLQTNNQPTASRARDHDSRMAGAKISFDSQDHVRFGRQCNGAIEFSDPLAETRLLHHHLAMRPTLLDEDLGSCQYCFLQLGTSMMWPVHYLGYLVLITRS